MLWNNGQRPGAINGVMVLLVILSLAGFQMNTQLFGCADRPRLSAPQMLRLSWDGYKQVFIQGDGRIIDHRANSISTSEGQSYALQRAVWRNDRSTFDTVYNWTNNNMRMRGDRLYAWKWGQKPDGSWGVLDRAAATDADQDIALALLMAARQWNDDRYRQEARALLADLWEKETRQTPIGRVLLPGDWGLESDGQSLRLNPSYFAPYAYRIFAVADPDHPWMELVQTSYKILQQAESKSGSQLPPDWLRLSIADGAVSLYLDDPSDRRSDFSYDAIRVPWRIVVDALVSNDSRADGILRPIGGTLTRYWQMRRQLPGPLSADGVERSTEEPLAAYGALLPVLARRDNRAACEIVARWMSDRMSPQGVWMPAEDYYAQNWLWFGLAAFHYQERLKEKAIARPTDALSGYLQLGQVPEEPQTATGNTR
jgi:endoglucanase